MGYECGWTHDFICDNFTVDQIFLYYTLIQKQKMLDLKFQAIVVAQSTAAGFGNSKTEEFDKFLAQLDPDTRPRSHKDPFDKMKEMGLPVEEN